MEKRLIDANALLDKQESLYMKGNVLFHGVTAFSVENAPTIDPETLQIVKELRREIDLLVNDGKQDLWAVERKRREEVEEELKREKKICDDLQKELVKVAKERDDALKAICTHCQDYPCQGESCYWFNMKGE